MTLNDSTLLGGNPPFQPMVTVANGLADAPGGASGGATDLPFGMQAQDVVFNLPTAYMWSMGVQREIPGRIVVDVSYVGRKGQYLQRERNINQLLPGTIQANPSINIAALRPYKGYGAIRLSENAGHSIYNSLQVSADRRYSNGLKLGAAYTLSKSEDNASDKRNVVWNTFDDGAFWGPSNYDRRHVFNFYYIYDLPWGGRQETLAKNLLGGWQISGATWLRTGAPFSVLRTNDIAGVGDGGFGQPYNLVGDANAGANKQFSNGSDNNFWFNPAAFAAPAAGTFGNAGRNILYNPGQSQWDIALFKNFVLGGTRRLQFRVLQLPEPSESRAHERQSDRRADERALGRPWLRGSDGGELRPHHHEEQRPPRHSAERAVHLLITQSTQRAELAEITSISAGSASLCSVRDRVNFSVLHHLFSL